MGYFTRKKNTGCLYEFLYEVTFKNAHDLSVYSTPFENRIFTFHYKYYESNI